MPKAMPRPVPMQKAQQLRAQTLEMLRLQWHRFWGFSQAGRGIANFPWQRPGKLRAIKAPGDTPAYCTALRFSCLCLGKLAIYPAGFGESPPQAPSKDATPAPVGEEAAPTTALAAEEAEETLESQALLATREARNRVIVADVLRGGPGNSSIIWFANTEARGAMGRSGVSRALYMYAIGKTLTVRSGGRTILTQLLQMNGKDSYICYPSDLPYWKTSYSTLQAHAYKFDIQSCTISLDKALNPEAKRTTAARSRGASSSNQAADAHDTRPDSGTNAFAGADIESDIWEALKAAPEATAAPALAAEQADETSETRLARNNAIMHEILRKDECTSIWFADVTSTGSTTVIDDGDPLVLYKMSKTLVVHMEGRTILTELLQLYDRDSEGRHIYTCFPRYLHYGETTYSVLQSHGNKFELESCTLSLAEASAAGADSKTIVDKDREEKVEGEEKAEDSGGEGEEDTEKDEAKAKDSEDEDEEEEEEEKATDPITKPNGPAQRKRAAVTPLPATGSKLTKTGADNVVASEQDKGNEKEEEEDYSEEEDKEEEKANDPEVEDDKEEDKRKRIWRTLLYQGHYESLVHFVVTYRARTHMLACLLTLDGRLKTWKSLKPNGV